MQDSEDGRKSSTGGRFPRTKMSLLRVESRGHCSEEDPRGTRGTTQAGVTQMCRDTGTGVFFLATYSGFPMGYGACQREDMLFFLLSNHGFHNARCLFPSLGPWVFPSPLIH